MKSRHLRSMLAPGFHGMARARRDVDKFVPYCSRKGQIPFNLNLVLSSLFF